MFSTDQPCTPHHGLVVAIIFTSITNICDSSHAKLSGNNYTLYLIITHYISYK